MILQLIQGIFALHLRFDIERLTEKRSILDISLEIRNRLFEHFRENPKRLYELSPCEFEELIAELFDRFGYTVALLSRTRDGGRDIIAIHNSLASGVSKWLKEYDKFKMRHA